MIKLIEELETALRHLREECVARGVTSSLDIAFYGSSMENKGTIHLIANHPVELTEWTTPETFIERLFNIETKEASKCRMKDLGKRNQRVIDLIEL